MRRADIKHKLFDSESHTIVEHTTRGYKLTEYLGIVPRISVFDEKCDGWFLIHLPTGTALFVEATITAARILAEEIEEIEGVYFEETAYKNVDPRGLLRDFLEKEAFWRKEL